MTLKLLLLRFLPQRFCALFSLMFLLASPSMAEGISIKNLGHSSLLIKGDNRSILLNPFKAVGCAEGLIESRLKVDIILASSELIDEGARNSEGTFFVKPGSYVVEGFAFEGVNVLHDRLGGRRYGLATLWTWKQGGLKIAHLGGAAGPLSLEDKFLLGRPDVLIIAVGGGAKVYDAQEAAEIIQDLKPKVVIPVQYMRGKTPVNCDLTGIQPFLEAMNGTKIKKVGRTFYISNKISDQMVIHLMD